MIDNERQQAAKMEAVKRCVEWVHTQLMELAGFDFTDEEIKAGLQAYLEETDKNVLELTQRDWENIYGDVLWKFLDSGETG